jgi:putative GTP pyrophosphokinase
VTETTTQQILEEFDLKSGLYSELTDKLHSLVSAVLEEQGISVHSVTCRVKGRDNLSKKLLKPGSSYSNLEEITDIAGIRITTFFSDDVDRVAELLEREFTIDWPNSIDKRAMLDPDRFGYLSLHHVLGLAEERAKLTEYRRFRGLKVEVQTRSILQHAWAEIEHDLGYKTASGVPNEIRRRFSRLAGLLEIADQEFVTIKDSLAAYKETVAERIERVPELVEINKTSLESFIRTSELVGRIDQTIARLVGGTVQATEPEYVEAEVPRLTKLGFSSIADIERSVAEHEAMIIDFAQLWLKDADRGLVFTKGVTILYFGYIIIGETQNKTLAKEHFESGIGLSSDRENLVNKVIETYQVISR